MSRRADAFAELLDAPRRSDDPDLAPFLALAGALRAVPAAAGPSPDFRAALRQRVLAVATVQGIGTEAPATQRLREAGATWRFQRRLAVLAGGAAAVTAIAGVGVGASRSLPGDPFYGVKRASERVQLATTDGQAAKGRRHLEFARTRLHEVEALAGRSSALAGLSPGVATAVAALPDEDRTGLIIDTLQDMDEETRSGANDLIAAYEGSGDIDLLRSLDGFSQDQFNDLRDLIPALPGDSREQARTSLALLTEVATRTVSLAEQTPAGDGSGDGTTPGTGTSQPPTQRPKPGPTSTAEPQQTSSPSGGGSDATPGAGGGDGGKSGPEVTVPTIPPSPVLPLPTEIPTSVPTLSPLPSLPALPDLPGIGD